MATLGCLHQGRQSRVSTVKVVFLVWSKQTRVFAIHPLRFTQVNNACDRKRRRPFRGRADSPKKLLISAPAGQHGRRLWRLQPTCARALPGLCARAAHVATVPAPP